MARVFAQHSKMTPSRPYRSGYVRSPHSANTNGEGEETHHTENLWEIVTILTKRLSVPEIIRE